jgi:hypothetical protein
MGRRGPQPNPKKFRRQRGIRFSDREWEEVKQRAEKSKTPVSTYVRETVLNRVEDPNSD